jgi:hypothetical protein
LQIGGGPLNPNIKIDPNSIGSGKISQDKIGGNIELAAAVKVTDANIDDGSINSSKLKDGNLDANVDVTNSNIGPATLRTDRYGFNPNRNPASVSCMAPSEPRQPVQAIQPGLSHPRFSCADETGNPLTTPVDLAACLRVSPASLTCAASAQANSVPLPTCVRVDGSQVQGPISAGQIGTGSVWRLADAHGMALRRAAV